MHSSVISSIHTKSAISIFSQGVNKNRFQEIYHLNYENYENVLFNKASVTKFCNMHGEVSEKLPRYNIKKYFIIDNYSH